MDIPTSKIIDVSWKFGGENLTSIILVSTRTISPPLFNATNETKS